MPLLSSWVISDSNCNSMLQGGKGNRINLGDDLSAALRYYYPNEDGSDYIGYKDSEDVVAEGKLGLYMLYMFWGLCFNMQILRYGSVACLMFTSFCRSPQKIDR